jgi:hypothetical protein
MKRVCAWCKQEMGDIEHAVQPDTRISHGICKNCIDNMTFQEGVTLQTYIDSLSVPIMVIAVHRGRAVVSGANKQAGLTLRKQPKEMVQHLAGNVFECAYARLPEGCGGTIHCSACTIRRSVIKTFETGEPQSLVPALLKQEQSGKTSSIAMHITTVKAEGMVMMRIDDMMLA